MLKIIATVGTSLFQNLEDDFDPNTKNTWRSLQQEPGDRWEERGGNDHDSSDSDIGSIRSFCAQPEFRARFSDSECSAETATLEKIIDETACDGGYEVYLLCTDTVLSRLAAEMLAVYSPILQGKTKVIRGDGEVKDETEGKVINGLSIFNAKTFKTEGLKNLVAEIRRIWKTQFDGESGKHRIILNASGGYKGVLPFLTIISQLYEFPIFYKYQDDENDITQELIKIDPIPFGFDWGLIYEVAPYLDQEWINLARKEENKKEREPSFEVVVFKEMKRIGDNGLNLINRENNRITDIGLMLRAFYEGIAIKNHNEADRSAPEDGHRSKTSSAIMELIFNDWRRKFSYQAKEKIYSNVLRSTGNEILRINDRVEFRSQIDILMQTEDCSGFVIGEVKYAYKISKELITHHLRQEQQYASDEAIQAKADEFKEIESQFEKRLRDCSDQKADEFHIYTFSAIPLSDSQRKMLTNSIDAIHKSLFKKTQIPVKAFYADVGSNPEAIATISLSSFNERIQQIYPTESHL